ncbi:tetraspanin-2a isoform X2 [Esox lucius]|uniref:tetraspanin-2a isoform X2 n=1 Tax=Esox lucius TaxID=8010 RepID=UPI001476B262|nr:tetraspanin-2a isoform X2 [Esox lucius]
MREISAINFQPHILAVYILIGAGGIMMLVGFFGCCGTLKESQCLLASFFACLIVIFGAEVAAGVFGFMNKEKIIDDVQKFYSESIMESSESSNRTAIVANYHTVLNCCSDSTSNLSLCTDAEDDTKDCLVAIMDFFNEKLNIIGYVGIGVAGVMIIGMIFSMVLCCAIRNNREVI